jgi:hypothetical protein
VLQASWSLPRSGIARAFPKAQAPLSHGCNQHNLTCFISYVSCSGSAERRRREASDRWSFGLPGSMQRVCNRLCMTQRPHRRIGIGALAQWYLVCVQSSFRSHSASSRVLQQNHRPVPSDGRLYTSPASFLAGTPNPGRRMLQYVLTIGLCLSGSAATQRTLSNLLCAGVSVRGSCKRAWQTCPPASMLRTTALGPCYEVSAQVMLLRWR